VGRKEKRPKHNRADQQAERKQLDGWRQEAEVRCRATEGRGQRELCRREVEGVWQKSRRQGAERGGRDNADTGKRRSEGNQRGLGKPKGGLCRREAGGQRNDQRARKKPETSVRRNQSRWKERKQLDGKETLPNTLIIK